MRGKAGEARGPGEPRAGAEPLCRTLEAGKTLTGRGSGARSRGGAPERDAFRLWHKGVVAKVHFRRLRCQRQKGTESTQF